MSVSVVVNSSLHICQCQNSCFFTPEHILLLNNSSQVSDILECVLRPFSPLTSKALGYGLTAVTYSTHIGQNDQSEKNFQKIKEELFISHFIFHISYFILYVLYILYPIYIIFNIAYHIFYILYFIFYILYFIFYILYFIFYILYFTFYILHFIFYI